MTERTAPPRQWSLGRRLGVAFAVAGVVLVIMAVIVAVFLSRLITASDRQVDRYDPALLASQNLLTAMINQETGLRGYVLSRNDQFLQPYTQGLTDQKTATTQLTQTLHSEPDLLDSLSAVDDAATAWQQQTADVRIAQVRSGNPSASQTVDDQADKARFDAVRRTSAELSADINDARRQAHRRLTDATTSLIAVLSVTAGLVVLTGFLAWGALRRWVQQPLRRLSAESNLVASGDFDHVVRADGPAELRQVGADVEAMRRRIAAELDQVEQARAQLAAQTVALEQSNADLEQFAYVASHDLQEPLRKVSNFCQLLERQYSAQLDDRARQYIDFAVDGAHRMQTLIQDLLGFSRVGRTTHEFEPVDLDGLSRQALATLEPTIAAAGAEVVLDAGLPTVPGDESLLATVLQNLIGNAVKYHGDRPPIVRITASGPAEGYYTIAVADNGIGIDPAYADRIFVIFQRLHLRDQYGGTGIGLAMCRKIIEYHGGKVWLDTEYTDGARFCFTLPERSPTT